MNGYTLTWRGVPTPSPWNGEGRGEGGARVPLDVWTLRPDTLGSLAPDALAQTPLRLGRTAVALADLFTISGSPGDTLTLRGLPPFPRLGERMTHGTLIIDGDAGDDLGASMKGGLIRVRGSAGHRAGGPATTSPRGMTGGEIVIEKDAGDHVGFRMRRGLIVVCGDTGASPGYQMLAGTIVLCRGAADHPGLEMRRGSVVVTGSNDVLEPGSHWKHDAEVLASAAPVFSLLARRLEQLGVRAAPPRRLRCWSGDRFELGKGELVQWLS